MPCVIFSGHLYNSLTLLGGILNQGSRPHTSYVWGKLDPKTCNCHERRKTLIALKIIGEEGSIWALIGHCILHAFTTTLLKYFLFRISWHLPPPSGGGTDFGHFGHKQDILHSSLNMDIFLRRSHFSIIFEKKNQQKPFTNYVYGNLTLPLTRELIITVRWSETEF